MILEEISAPIKEDLKVYEKEFMVLLKSNVLLIDKVVHYISTSKGKRLRPMLVILTSRLHDRNGGLPDLRNMKAAAIMELLHVASLVHDDVVDRSNQRRGLPSVNRIWKNKVSVLMGDYLFSKALVAMLSMKSMRVYEIISETAERMTQGELLGIERSKDYWMEEEVYFRLISDKTASLIAAACQLGAVSASDDEDDIATMREFGENLGIAFQIRDDLLDILGKEKKTGKPLGNDIRDNKVTLPIIHALKQAEKKDARRIIRLIKKTAKRHEIKEIITFVEDHGGIEYAMRRAKGHIDLAKKALERYPQNQYRASLEKLVDFITTRES